MTRKKSVFMAIVLLLIFSVVIYLEKQSTAQPVSGNPQGTTVHGRVVSRYGPVKHARVRVAGDERYALTNSEGEFMLPTGHVSGGRVLVTAGKEGWFNNGQISYPFGRTRDIFLNPVYLNDRPDYRFISPVICSRCHVKVTRYWDQSKMAHTTSNPRVRDMFYGTDAYGRAGMEPGYRLDNPGSNGNCVTCHAPSVAASSPPALPSGRPASPEGEGSRWRAGPWSQDLESALRSPLTEWDGISCDYCHKVRKVLPDKTRPSGMSAVLERQSAPGSSSILVFGPYDDVVVPPMAASYSRVFQQGEFCSTCHSHFKKLDEGKAWDHSKVYSPAEWKGFGLEDETLLPIQTTYQEWRQWQDQLPFNDPNKGKKCQDCHMSWRKEMLPYDNYVVDGMAQHMWGTYRPAQSINPHHFDGGTETQLKTALSMELEGEVIDKRLDINVYITNTNGGHWVPTGETMRSVMLLLQAFDSKGKPLKMVDGSVLPDWTGKGDIEEGNYADRPGAVFARVLQDDEGNIHVPFWRATRIASDTRVRQKSTVTLKWAFALEDPEDEPTAEAKLIYRPAIRPWAEKKRWSAQDILIVSKVW